MKTKPSRRDFLKLSALGLGSLAFRPFLGKNDHLEAGDLGRVATTSVTVHSLPWDESRILYTRTRNELLNIYYEVTSEHGPDYNPVWYRVWGGYVHSARIQKVQFRLNPVLQKIPEKGQLAQVTVPFSQAIRDLKSMGYQNIYRLYYQSLHWITGLQAGPDGEPWYVLKDELLEIEYLVPAAHMRPIPYEEYSPIAQDVPAHQKRLDVSIGQQKVWAYEKDQLVFETRISSGLDYQPPGEKIPWKTPLGTFHIESKMPSKHMGDGNITSDPEAYELPGVPWVSFFEPKTGVAFHGTYWHNNYGVRMSHGCVNMRPEEALWLFRWSTPVVEQGIVETRGYGTLVNVFL